MTDYEALRAMYDKAGIRYAIGDATMANFYCDKGVMDMAYSSSTPSSRRVTS